MTKEKCKCRKTSIEIVNGGFYRDERISIPSAENPVSAITFAYLPI